MIPFRVRAELQRRAQDLGSTLYLRLDPIAAKVAIPIMRFPGDRQANMNVLVDKARDMVRATRTLVSETLVTAIVGQAVPDFDFEEFERDELESYRQENTRLKAAVEDRDRAIRKAKTVFEATGMSWSAVERTPA